MSEFPRIFHSVEFDGPFQRCLNCESTFDELAVPHIISKAFRGYPVALRPTPIDGVWSVWFMTHRVAQVDLKESEPLIESVSDVSEHV